MRRMLCLLIGHKWLGCWKRHPTDRTGEAAEFCARCHLWKSLVWDYKHDTPHHEQPPRVYDSDLVDRGGFGGTGQGQQP